MKMTNIPWVVGAATIALAVTACGANSKYGAAQRAENRAQEERQEAREARADADKARLEAAEAQQRAQLAEQTGRDADQSAQIASQRAAQAELQASGSVARRRAGVAETQRESPILFASGTADLSPEAKARLADIATSLRGRHTGHAVAVEGYADESGSEAANADLSRRRADAVASYLVSLGIPRDRFTAKGLGSRNPISREDSDRGRAANRRVEIVIAP